MKDNRRFGGTYHFQLQNRRATQARNQKKKPQSELRLLGLFFDPEDGSDIIFRNVG
jgi:hypothetical protein